VLVLAGGLVCGQAAADRSTSTPKPTVSTSSNPLLPNALFAEYDKIKAQHVIPAFKQVMQEEGAALDLLEADLEAAGKDVTYERLFRPYAQIRYRLDITSGLVSNLQVRMHRHSTGHHSLRLQAAGCFAARKAAQHHQLFFRPLATSPPDALAAGSTSQPCRPMAPWQTQPIHHVSRTITHAATCWHPPPPATRAPTTL
jgi:hypothetical protein